RRQIRNRAHDGARADRARRLRRARRRAQPRARAHEPGHRRRDTDSRPPELVESPMYNLLNYPPIVFVLTFVLMWVAALIGARLQRTRRIPNEGAREDFSVVLAATLTLLGLIIGFSFSMAISRYDQRKNLEEEEANAIGTQYLRAGLLPAADASRVRALLKEYLDVRIEFYEARDPKRLAEIPVRRAKLQADLWAAMQGPAAA